MAADIFTHLVSSLHGSLDYHLERQNVLVSNLAHVDTPGYVPRDLARTSGASFADALRVGMEATDPHHMMAGGDGGLRSAGRVVEDPAPGAGNDRNYVSLDRESAKVAANQVRYDVLTVLVQAELADLSFAVGDGKSG